MQIDICLCQGNSQNRRELLNQLSSMKTVVIHLKFLQRSRLTVPLTIKIIPYINNKIIYKYNIFTKYCPQVCTSHFAHLLLDMTKSWKGRLCLKVGTSLVYNVCYFNLKNIILNGYRSQNKCIKWFCKSQ